MTVFSLFDSSTLHLQLHSLEIFIINNNYMPLYFRTNLCRALQFCKQQVMCNKNYMDLTKRNALPYYNFSQLN